jgi:hypothetical protein
MTAGLIVIEIAASTPPPAELGVLVAACNRAAVSAECALAKDPPERAASAVAIVTLEGPDRVRVELGVRRDEHDQWRTREFAFLAQDDSLERWRAIGFTIGTLFGSEPEPAGSPQQVPIQAPVRDTPPPTPRPRPRAAGVAKPEFPAGVFVDAGMVTGPGLDVGPWRLGGAARLAIQPLPPPFYVSLGGSAAMRVSRGAAGTGARWFDVTLGAGYSLLGTLSASGVELRADLGLERFSIEVTAPSGRSDSGGRWLFVAGAGVAGRLRIASGLLAVAEVQGSLSPAQTDVRVSGASVGTASMLRYAGLVGLRVQLH